MFSAIGPVLIPLSFRRHFPHLSAYPSIIRDSSNRRTHIVLTKKQYKDNGQFFQHGTSSMAVVRVSSGPQSWPHHLEFRVLAEAAHADIADALTVHPICQEELYNPGRDVSIKPNENSILTP